MPTLGRQVLADLEIPCAAARVSWIFPYRLHAQVEEVYRVSQLQVLYRYVVEVLVELLDGDNLVSKRLGPSKVLF